MLYELIIYCVLVGGVGSLLQGMIGIGTGIVIVPFLNFILPQYGFSPEQAIHIALATSLMAIAINSISALIGHHRNEAIKWSLFRKIILFSLLGSGVGSITASLAAGSYLEIIYGVFLVLISLYMVFKKSRADSEIHEQPIPKKILAMGGFGGGFISSMLGSGGGMIMIPFLQAFRIKMRHSVGTSTLIGLPVTIMGACIFIGVGLTKVSLPYTIGFLHWPALLSFILIGMIGAPLGVKLSTLLPTQWVRRLFAFFMASVGIKMIVNHFCFLQSIL